MTSYHNRRELLGARCTRPSALAFAAGVRVPGYECRGTRVIVPGYKGISAGVRGY